MLEWSLTFFCGCIYFLLFNKKMFLWACMLQFYILTVNVLSFISWKNYSCENHPDNIVPLYYCYTVVFSDSSKFRTIPKTLALTAKSQTFLKKYKSWHWWIQLKASTEQTPQKDHMRCPNKPQWHIGSVVLQPMSIFDFRTIWCV